MTPEEERAMCVGIERIIGPPEGYDKIVNVEPIAAYIFMTCVEEKCVECPEFAGSVKCLCKCHAATGAKVNREGKER